VPSRRKRRRRPPGWSGSDSGLFPARSAGTSEAFALHARV
jgi:hypothetical protein